MSSDPLKRQMDFILEQHAKLDLRFDEKMHELEEKQRQNTEDIAKLVGVVMNLTLNVQENDREIAALIQHSKESDKRIDQLTANGKETDARLNVLISVVERYFNNGNKRQAR